MVINPPHVSLFSLALSGLLALTVSAIGWLSAHTRRG